MQLILWRHAEAEDDAPSDLARALTARGRKQAEKMAAWFKSHAQGDAQNWHVMSSPAVRALQTAAALGFPVETVESIAPDAPADNVLAAANWPKAKRNIIVVGHQPTLGMVAARLINGVDGYVSVKKGAMWWFETRERDGTRQAVLRAMASPDATGDRKN